MNIISNPPASSSPPYHRCYYRVSAPACVFIPPSDGVIEYDIDGDPILLLTDRLMHCVRPWPSLNQFYLLLCETPAAAAFRELFKEQKRSDRQKRANR